MKTLLYALGICGIVTGLIIFLIIIIPKPKPEVESITYYTIEDIYYLEGNTVTSQSGIIDTTFNSRNEAINYYENISVAIARRTIDVLDSLTGNNEE